MISLLTTVPAILLFFEYGMFTSSTGYWLENWDDRCSVLAYGVVMCVVLSILLVTLSAYLQRWPRSRSPGPAIFVMLGRLGRLPEGRHRQ